MADDADGTDLVLSDAGELEYLILVSAISDWAIREAQSGDFDMASRLSNIVAGLTLENPEIAREALKDTPSQHIIGEKNELLDELGLTIDDEGMIREKVSDDAVSIDVD